ncbi:MAG: HlyD family efflux transporter periplasmic adaptor subunit [Magnetococcus sp. DMHC-6]
MMSSPPLVVLLQLAERARGVTTVEELLFVIVNETHALVSYRQAVLWNGDGKVVALSGIPVLDPQVPFILWLQRLYSQLRQAPIEAPLQLEGHAAPDGLQEGWEEWLPEHALAIALKVGDKKLGWLFLARELPFELAEIELLNYLAGAYGHAWMCHLGRVKQAWWHQPIPRRKKLLFFILFGLILFWRVPLTLLAPAEIVPIQPEVVRAPMDGVVLRFHVQPNDPIQVGQPLFDLDDTTLKSRLEVAEKSFTISESEYKITSQLALQDPRSKTQLAILAGRAEEKQLEADGLRDLLARSRVKASQSGIALFSDPQSWIGRPVQTGERILTIAEERQIEVEAWPAAGALIPLPKEASVTLFLNIDPLHPRAAHMRLLSYESTVRPDGTVAHQLRATLQERGDPPLRLGLRGIARIEGERVSLFWWIIRRPVAMVRQWLGW